MGTTMRLRLRLTRAGRRLFVLGAMMLLALGVTVGVGAPQAAALGVGTACMINAPSGATAGPVNFGHVGWAFQEGGTSRWFFGATENGGGSGYVAPGGNTQTWIASGTQSQMFAAFKYAGHFHRYGYYTKWRCHMVLHSAVTAALNEQRNQAASGYFLPTNNCLTKSVAILNAYGVGLGYPGYAQAPNNYFDNLGNAGWGPVHPL